MYKTKKNIIRYTKEDLKYKIGDCFIVHDRWVENYKKDPIHNNPFSKQISFFDEEFILKHINCLVQIQNAEINSYPEADIKTYTLKFFCDEYYQNKDRVTSTYGYIVEEDLIPCFLDPIDMKDTEALLRLV